MKKNKNSLHKILLAVIGVLTIVLVAVMIRKAYIWQQDKVRQQELEVRRQEIQSEIDDIELQIKELSGDGAALQQFLDEKIIRAKEEKERAAQERANDWKETDTLNALDGISGNDTVTANDAVSGNGAVSSNDTVSSNEAAVNAAVSANNAAPESGSEAPVSGNSVSDNTMPDNDSVSDNTASGKNISDSGISGNSVSDNIIPDSGVSGNAIVNGTVIPFRYEEQLLSLEDRNNIQSSYAETMQINEKDRAVLADKTVDFSEVTIACLGDSLTEGSTGDDGVKYSYPSMLKSILNAKEVYNLGIGGSSLGRYWDKAFVERYKDIPADADVILVMGGTNDGFCASTDELGSLAERKRRTFYGDVDELMKGLKKDYPQAKIIFATPLPNVLHDYLMTQRDFLLPQTVFVQAVKELAAEYGIDVIDLYNSNLLDTHDSQIIANYMPDGVHGNEAGYQILAEHFAGALIEIFERDALHAATVSGNTISGNSVSANQPEEAAEGNYTDTEDISGAQAAEGTQEQAAEAQVTEEVEGTDAASEGNTVDRNFEYSGEAIIIQ